MATGTYLILDVGGDDLVVEVSEAARNYRNDGISERDAMNGGTLTAVTFQQKRSEDYTTGPITTDELEAIVAAAKYPQKILVSGEFWRTTDEQPTLPTVLATVNVQSAAYLRVGVNHLHQARLTVSQVAPI